MAAQLSFSAEQEARQFGTVQDEVVQFVCEILFEPEAAAFGALQRQAQDAALGHVGEYLEALRCCGHSTGASADQRAWFADMLTAHGASVAQVEGFNAALAAFLAKHPDPDARAIAGVLASASPGLAVPAARPPKAGEVGPETPSLTAALLDGNLPDALAIFEAARGRGSSLLDFETQVIEPALCAIGERCERAGVSHAQALLAYETALTLMTAGRLGFPRHPPAASRIVLACVAGNRHALGLRMVADAFCVAGWAVDYLGADVPTDALVAFIAERCPDAVGVSLACPSHVQELRGLADQLRATFGSHRPALIAGGAALRRTNRLTDIPGVDLIGLDLSTAVAGATRLSQVVG